MLLTFQHKLLMPQHRLPSNKQKLSLSRDNVLDRSHKPPSREYKLLVLGHKLLTCRARMPCDGYHTDCRGRACPYPLFLFRNMQKKHAGRDKPLPLHQSVVFVGQL